MEKKKHYNVVLLLKKRVRNDIPWPCMNGSSQFCCNAQYDK